MLIFSLLCCRWQKTKEWVGPCLPACLSGARAKPSCPRSTTFLTRNTACTQPLCNGPPNTSTPTKCTHTPLSGIECRNAHFTPTWFSVMSSIKVHKSELAVISLYQSSKLIVNYICLQHVLDKDCSFRLLNLACTFPQCYTSKLICL